MISEYKTVGVILNDESKQGLNHTFFSEILEACKLELQKEGISLLFLNNDRSFDGAKSYTTQLKEYGCIACILACLDNSKEEEEILASGVPVVAIDKDYPNAINVSSNNEKGMEMLTEYVISMGHKRIAYIMGDDNTIANSRLNVFLKTCERNKVQIPDGLLIRGKFRDIKQTMYHTENLLKMEIPPTCIMFSDDYASIGGINIINARGLFIPKDISITGYDGNDILEQYEPKITTIKQDGSQMGRLAAEKIIEAINDPQNIHYGNYYVDVTLERGRTVKKVYTKL